MSDMRIQYQEEMVGAGHPTKPDTLNRLALVEADQDGRGKCRFLKAQASAPATLAGEGALYTRLAGGQPELFYRSAASASEVRLTCAAGPGALLLPRSLPGLLPDPKEPPEYDANLGAVRLGNAGCLAWGHFEAWLDNQAWTLTLEGMMSTAQSATLSLILLYQVFGPSASMDPVKQRWWPATAYLVGDRLIPATPNGCQYQATVAGTSGGSEPTWPSVVGQTVVSGGATFQCLGPGMIAQTQTNLSPPAAAYQRFDLAGPDLRIPAGQAAAGDRVHFAIWRSGGDPHGGDLLVNDLWVAPVEV